jgi:hypothetical protein
VKYANVFVEMFSAYKREIGEAFPSADPTSVLKILRECNKLDAQPNQREIQQATGITQSKLAG